jgi:alcohol dehydrogenase class IV
MKFELFLSGRIIFELGSRSQIGEIASSIGNRVFLLYAKNHPLVPEIRDRLKGIGLDLLALPISGEPDLESVSNFVTEGRIHDSNLVISIGGGSVIDTGKVVSAMLNNPGEISDYLEIVGMNLPLQNKPAPFIAVPTTAGTGSEVTKNAVLVIPTKKIKVSMRSNMMIPQIAIIDPELTVSMPSPVTASTGMDAIIQLIEPFVSIKANHFVDGLCREAIPLGANSLTQSVADGMNLRSREDMCFTSLCGGLALANAGLGAVHGFAGVIGGMKTVPHGMICAALLAGTLKVNIEALKKRQPDSPSTRKFEELAIILTGNKNAGIFDSVGWAERVSMEIGIKRLSELGIFEKQFHEICEKAALSSSMKGNPILLEKGEMLQILELSK